MEGATAPSGWKPPATKAGMGRAGPGKRLYALVPKQRVAHCVLRRAGRFSKERAEERARERERESLAPPSEGGGGRHAGEREREREERETRTRLHPSEIFGSRPGGQCRNGSTLPPPHPPPCCASVRVLRARRRSELLCSRSRTGRGATARTALRRRGPASPALACELEGAAARAGPVLLAALPGTAERAAAGPLVLA